MAERREPPRRDSESSGQQPEIKPVVDLLASILSEVQKQVQSKAPPPLAEGAQVAVEKFTEISAALALQPSATITLRADPAQFGINGGTAKLIWSSSQARRVSIDQKVGDVTTSLGEVKPAANGFIEVNVLATTIFTATAQGPCGSATASATVAVQIVG
jgi:hypothetical protein